MNRVFDFEKLEFEKLIEIVKKYCFSEFGKEKVSLLVPLENPERELIKVQELMDLFIQFGEPPVGGIYKINDYILKANSGEILDPEILLIINSTFQGIKKLKEWFLQNCINFKNLFEIVSVMEEQEKIIFEISKSIEPEGIVSDKASSKLRQIRTDIKRAYSKLKNTLNSLLGGSLKEHIQQQTFILRGGRYLIPIKSSSRSAVKGIIHSSSGSGATYYMETEEMILENDKLRTLESEEIEEVNRILRNISSMIVKNSFKIEETLELISIFDSLWARAKFALKFDAIIPDISESAEFELYNAKHPLIGKNCVPITVRIGNGVKGIIITGPNTGGKTVTLKTVGLNHIMALSGIPIMADKGSKIGNYNNILADIGDEQSIEQSLSTFSGHLKNIRRIVDISDSNSLILLDELGAGTDPVEGAALGLGLIETLLLKGSRMIVTSHLSPLKLFAYTEESLENASVQFDLETLTPTFHLIVGVAGSSNAFKIAQRLGLQEEVLERSGKFLNKEFQNIEEVINNLQNEKIQINEELHKAKEIREELEKKEIRLSDSLDKVKKKKYEDFLEDYSFIENWIKEIKKEIEGLVGNMRKSKEKSLKENEDLNRKISSLYSKKVKELEKTLELSNPFIENEEETAEDIFLGDYVKMKGSDFSLKVLEIKRDMYIVEKDGIKIELKKDKIEKTDIPEKKELSEQVYFYEKKNYGFYGNEIDLRGKNVEDSIQEIEKFIESLIMNNLSSGSIIHGKGTGKLAEGIWAKLSKDPRIKAFNIGKPQEGGTGVTIIHL